MKSRPSVFVYGINICIIAEEVPNILSLSGLVESRPSVFVYGMNANTLTT
jgi:hypothetical protein